MDEGERAVYLAATTDYAGFVLFFFENGKAAKVEMSAYETKTNRKKLINAYSDKSPLVSALYIREDCEVLLTASSGRMLLFHTGQILPKTTKNTQGVQAMNLKKGQRLISAKAYEEGIFYRLLTTNLVYQTPELLSREWYINCDMSKYIAYLIDTLNHDASISDLLNPNERIQSIVARYKSGELDHLA